MSREDQVILCQKLFYALEIGDEESRDNAIHDIVNGELLKVRQLNVVSFR